MKKLFKKKYMIWWIGLGFLVTFFVSRLTNLFYVPIFTDEAIYIRWAQYFLNDSKFWDYSMTDGKQPLFVWITTAFMQFISDPLLAGRLVSVFAGLFSMIGIYLLSNEIFKNRRIGLIAAFLYLVYPFALVYDRIALYDSLVATFIIWALYLEVLLIRRLDIRIAVVLGVVIGLGLLNKTSSNFALILLPFLLLLFNFKDKHWKKNLVKLVIYAAIAAAISQVIYMLLRLSPYFYIIAQKNAVFVYTFEEWLQHPFAYLIPNLKTLTGWLIDYSTIPFLIFVLAALFIGKKNIREKLLLLAWFIVPFVSLAMFGRLLYPRYILFMTMPLLVLGAYTLYTLIQNLPSRAIKAGIFFVFILPFLIADFLIITDFERAPIPRSDKNQFYVSWPAGIGVKETIEILDKESKDKKIFVGTQGTFGLMPYALEMYLYNNPNIKIIGIWPINATPPKELTEASKSMPTYVLFYQPCPSCKHIGEAPSSWNLKKVYQIERSEQNSFTTLYQLPKP